ncbi:hypothetical protein, partial [Actinomadura latina]|uniref:hypothetical protein n=1 Tax=Actinomadura latina TaxID=163603 RepID=UPI001C3F35BD
MKLAKICARIKGRVRVVVGGKIVVSMSAVVVASRREWEDREWFPPSPQLAVCLSGDKSRLADLTDDELLQVAAAARRQTSWA